MRYPKRLKLANLPTPIHKLEKLSKEVGKDIFCWRDDLTDFVASGNKIRKLEFVFGEALEKKAKSVVTCGGPQSNHARATVFIAKRLGFEAHVIVREPSEGLDKEAPSTGNLLLNKIAGAKLHYISMSDYRAQGSVYDSFLDEQAYRIKQEGGKPYIIPEGASCPVGVFGYLFAAEEMFSTWKEMEMQTRAPDAVFFAMGSGGTLAGLHLGFEARGVPTERLHAVNVCDDAEYFTKRVTQLLDDTCGQYGIKSQNRQFQIHDGYVGEGYGKASDEDLKFYMELVRKEGLLLDPCYTGKAFQAMLTEIKKDPKAYGKNILFLHSGGIFANFAYARQFESLC